MNPHKLNTIILPIACYAMPGKVVGTRSTMSYVESVISSPEINHNKPPLVGFIGPFTNQPFLSKGTEESYLEGKSAQSGFGDQIFRKPQRNCNNIILCSLHGVKFYIQICNLLMIKFESEVAVKDISLSLIECPNIDL